MTHEYEKQLSSDLQAAEQVAHVVNKTRLLLSSTGKPSPLLSLQRQGLAANALRCSHATR